MESFKAAAVQLNSQPYLDLNLEISYQCIRQAARGGARLVGLPENFSFLGDLEAKMEQAEKIAEQSESFLKEAAAEFEIYLLGGSFPVPASNAKVRNRSLLLAPNGTVIATYDKIHLFDVDLDQGESYRESDYVEGGELEAVVAETDDLGKIGLSICYDLRFPELYRLLAANQASLFTIPSAFTRTTGKDHWFPLLRARAIENTAFIFAPAQTGRHGEKRKTYGHSLIIDPWGKVLADGGEEPGVIFADIEADTLHEVRRSIPSLIHRRL
jgi:predicted amidohydrolase